MATRRPSARTRRGDEAAARDAAFRCIRALVAALHTSARAVEHRTGLTNAQLFLLHHLADAGPLTVNELAARARAGQSVVSIVVAKLARSGYVKRGRVPGDARRVTLSATAKGRAILRRAPTSATERLLAALAELPLRDVRALHRGIESLLETIGPHPARAPLLFEPTRVAKRA